MGVQAVLINFWCLARQYQVDKGEKGYSPQGNCTNVSQGSNHERDTCLSNQSQQNHRKPQSSELMNIEQNIGQIRVKCNQHAQTETEQLLSSLRYPKPESQFFLFTGMFTFLLPCFNVTSSNLPGATTLKTSWAERLEPVYVSVWARSPDGLPCSVTPMAKGVI